MIDNIRFQRVVSEALSRLKIINVKYKPLKPYLVFTAGGKQIDFTTDISQILESLPVMVLDSAEKTKACELMDALKKIDEKDEKKSKPKLISEIQVLSCKLQLTEIAQIEVRTQILRYSLIRKLKKDPLIDRELTTQSDASIRIVMGTLGALAGTKAEFMLNPYDPNQSRSG
jgi:hypothetical protein